MPSKPEVHKEYMKRYLSNPVNKQKHLERTKRNNERYKQQLVEVLSLFRAGGCSFCTEKEPACLQAHHLDPTQKDMAVSMMCRSRWSAKRVSQELEKCICVCANCHFKIHAGLIDCSGAGGDAG